jgi:hypothetical protein
MASSALIDESRPNRPLQSYSVFFIIAAACICFSIFPATMCFDCEPDYTYGRSKEINDLSWAIFEAWILIAPFTAALFRLNYASLIPIALALANIATQHLGGAPWWTIRNNEGPVVLLIAIPIGFLSLALGYLCNIAYTLFRRKQHKYPYRG